MDEEAKVRAHAVLHGGAGIDEALKAMAQGSLSQLQWGSRRASVWCMSMVLELLGAVVGVVRQEDTDDAVPSSLEGAQVAGVVEVLTDEFSTTWEGVVHPHPAVVVRVAVALFSIKVPRLVGKGGGWEEGKRGPTIRHEHWLVR